MKIFYYFVFVLSLVHAQLQRKNQVQLFTVQVMGLPPHPWSLRLELQKPEVLPSTVIAITNLQLHPQERGAIS